MVLKFKESARHKRQRKDVTDSGSKRRRTDNSEEECLPWFDPALLVKAKEARLRYHGI